MTVYNSIQINYRAAVTIDIEDVCKELGLNQDEISKIQVRYNILTITTINNKDYTYEFDSLLFNEDINTKKPESIMLHKSRSFEIAMSDAISLHTLED
tara:strand:- start:39 stop:332 length:294 start_codon:yes stop_codon:yes gene_type:complete